jgi:hypothetical protein
MIESQLRELNLSLIENRMTIGPAFATIADIVLKFGRPFARRPLPKGRWRRGLGLCYANALQAAKTRRYVYVEGYATGLAGGIPQHHAWVTDPRDFSVAYDPTWGRGAEYFGIPFRLDYLLKAYEESGHPGVLDAWEMKWPLVSGEHRIENAVWKPGS